MDVEQIEKIYDDIKRAVADLPFPAHRDQVVEKAKEFGADPDMIQTLRRLPPRNFENHEDLMRRMPMEEFGDNAQEGPGEE